jgi:hypothetical protein
MDNVKLKTLLRLRFDQRNYVFQRAIISKIEEANHRGMLYSSSCVSALHSLLKKEFEDSSTIIISTIIDVLREYNTTPIIDELRPIYINEITSRKIELESIFNQRASRIADSLQNQNMITGFRNLDNEEELVMENGKVDLKHKSDGYKSELGGNFRDILISKWKDNKVFASVSIIITAIVVIAGFITAINNISVWFG